MPPVVVPPPHSANSRVIQREPSEEYDDDFTYEDEGYAGGYRQSDEILEEKLSNTHLADDEIDVPDTTMLDSVILPAIASVRIVRFISPVVVVLTHLSNSFSLVYQRKRHEWH